MSVLPQFKLRTSQQKSFLLFAFFLLIAVAGLLIYRSNKNSAIISLGKALGKTEDPFVEISLGGEDTKLHLRDFHRIQIERGDVTWDLKASEARYMPENNLAYINEPDVVVYRKGEKPFNLEARAGKLYLENQRMKKAELEGDIHLFLDQELSAKTDYAVLEVQKQRVNSPNTVLVEGQGFKISGKDMLADLEHKKIKLQSRVRSEFFPAQIKGVKKP